MKSRFFRQLIALALLAFMVPALHAQFEKLYYYGPVLAPNVGMFMDVECLENILPTPDRIAAVGTDNAAPNNALFTMHDAAGNPVLYKKFNYAAPVTLQSVALCSTPGKNLIACFYEPGIQSTHIISLDRNGVVNWKSTVPNFMVRDVTAGPGAAPGAPARIWMSGNTVAPLMNAAVVGYNDAGVFAFHTDYPFPAPYQNGIGFEIDFNTTTGNLTVAGVMGSTQCTDGILVLRLNALGGLVNRWIYMSNGCNVNLRGKALVQTPGAAGHYTIAFERVVAGAPANSWPGLMDIDGAGNVIYITYKTAPAGFFNGTFYTVQGMDTDGANLLVSGTFTNGTTVLPAGYTLNAVGLTGVGVRYNEYQTTATYPGSRSNLLDIDYYTAAGKYVIGGQYRGTVPVGGIWPMGAFNDPFWIVEANANGGMGCSSNVLPIENAVPYNRLQPLPVPANLAVPVACTLNEYVLAPTAFSNCAAPKRGNDEPIVQTLTQMTPAFAYLEGQDQILVRIPAEVRSQVAVTLIDLQGRVMSRMNVGTGETRIDVSQWAAGVYFIQYQGEGIQAGVQKVAIR